MCAPDDSVPFASALSLSLAVIPYWWDWVLARDEVTIPRSGFVLDK